MPAENLLSPDTVRRVMWDARRRPTADAVARPAARVGARAWQVELAAPMLVDAIVAGRVEARAGDLDAGTRSGSARG